ncbi:ornithine carbamoyltransferase [Dichotomicrobium thermohalophilum]|uniref:Ornithine carbamoyltransferase n=1 Tax=Dichotomicrobium thermohalophilum TaxID=933063 RepID=A0A397PGD1_9HYPH|nr:ornithine carbamoyltransferase [Dichotomicrobium thermohalophilum]RIA47523.1 ornithine carbamoyltransferase [Dichotomicrobium thermohalophilum]
MTPRHFLDLNRLEQSQLHRLMARAHDMKARFQRDRLSIAHLARGQVLAMLFSKPSTRTRVSFDVAMRQLGGETIVLNANELQLGRGETIADTARVLSRYVDVIMLRTTAHADLLELAEHADVPVINGLTDLSHPCQVFADVMTFEEYLGPISGRKIAWIGDANNNVATSWLHAASMFGFILSIACPEAYRPSPELVQDTTARGGQIVIHEDPGEAIAGADCVLTDVWVSMGHDDGDRRMKMLRDYQVDAALMSRAAPHAIFMHCLPAQRGHEVTGEVIDGPQSVVFEEAENRMHAQRAILAWCLEAE